MTDRTSDIRVGGPALRSTRWSKLLRAGAVMLLSGCRGTSCFDPTEIMICVGLFLLVVIVGLIILRND